MFLVLAIYFMASVTLAGSLIVAALTTGYDSYMQITYAALAGFVIALPVTWMVAKKLRG